MRLRNGLVRDPVYEGAIRIVISGADTTLLNRILVVALALRVRTSLK